MEDTPITIEETPIKMETKLEETPIKLGPIEAPEKTPIKLEETPIKMEIKMEETPETPIQMEEPPIKKQKITCQSDAGASGRKRIRTSGMLSDAAHKLVDALNEKRKRDTEMLHNMRAMIVSLMERICTTVEQYMYSLHERRNKVFNEKIDTLFAHLEQIANVETELAQFKRELAILYKEVESSSDIP